MTSGHTLRQLQTQDELRAHLVKMFAEVVEKDPEAVLVLAKCGADLVLRMAGSTANVVRLYAESGEEVERALRDLVLQAVGRRNG